MAEQNNREENAKLLKSLSYDAFDLLSLHLRPKYDGKDWKSLAGLIGFSINEINWLNEEPDPAMTLLNRWMARDVDASTDQLIDYLKELRRLDTVKDLQPFIEKAPTKEEYQKKQQELEQKTEGNNSKAPATVEENYDVFISYAEEDKEFAKLLLKTLEREPYNLKGCISVRDFLPGMFSLEQVVEAIEDRCKKVIAILSDAYVKCEKCDHQVKVSLALSPGCKQRRLIPVLYRKCEIPKIMKSIYYLDYTDDYVRVNFWKRLHAAVKA